jgi:hypothetical protein
MCTTAGAGFRASGSTAWLQQPAAAVKASDHLLCPAVVFCPPSQVPLPVRERVYDMLAANRYRLFGKTPTCQVCVDTLAVCECFVAITRIQHHPVVMRICCCPLTRFAARVCPCLSRPHACAITLFEPASPCASAVAL